MFEVYYYQRVNGSKPIEEFLDNLDVRMRAAAFKEIEILKKRGSEIREPHSKPMGNGLFELRIKETGRISRVFYFFVIGQKVILTNGYLKKTKRTPKRYLQQAMEYKLDYEKRTQEANEDG
jgi:phage-related protein